MRYQVTVMSNPGQVHESNACAPPDASADIAGNDAVAGRLRDAASLLEEQGANPFRVAAYRHAADTVSNLDTEVRDLVERRGMEGLTALPGIGRGIAAAIVEMVALGRWSQLERWRGEVDPLQTLRRIPGIGPQLAARLHDELHVDSLEALELAAHDGRLERVRGIGPRKAAAFRASLATMLGQWHGRARSGSLDDGVSPDVSILLDVDREYRERSAAGELGMIAPRRFNPRGERWLPILHTERGDWHFTALYSNTARAHDLGRTRDWVIVYFYDGDHREQQVTVVTETRGALQGQRVVRGRELECAHCRAAGRVP